MWRKLALGLKGAVFSKTDSDTLGGPEPVVSGHSACRTVHQHHFGGSAACDATGSATHQWILLPEA